MRCRYSIRDYLHFAAMYRRSRRRHRAWERSYEESVRLGTFTLPSAAVVQLIPTEACNLRCPMCNQWGENGYFLSGLRKVDHMNPESLERLMRSLSPVDSLVSVHGGEPFAYRHIDTLLNLIGERQFDVIFTTNGTLLARHYRRLAGIRNLAFLLSIDGDRQTHDRIRGEGRFEQAKEQMASLFSLRREMKLPLPLLIISTVVCEWTSEIIERVYEVACSFNAFAVNFNMRWFLTEEIGSAYEEHLERHMGIRSSGAWRGWVSSAHDSHDYTQAARALQKVVERHRRRLLPPYVITTPAGLRERDFEHYFSDYLNTFGNESCFMPYYWARIHANGDLIYCPGHPDVIAGNVFRDGFLEAFNSEVSVRFRRHLLNNRMPICNRCCGLYMTNAARPNEQRARRRLGLSKAVAADPLS